MKKVVLLLVVAFSIYSCQETQQKDLETFEGEFIYLADAAVLKGDTFIYGVVLDEKMEELAMTVKPLKRDDFDMVPVIVKGHLTNKEEGAEGWDEVLTIVEVLEVKAPKGPSAVKIEGDQTIIELESLNQDGKKKTNK